MKVMKTVVGGGERYLAWEIEENVRDGKKSRKSIKFLVLKVEGVKTLD